MTQEILTAVFGWMTVLNFAILLFSSLMIVTMQDWIAGIHSKMFQMEQAEVKKATSSFWQTTSYLLLSSA